MIPAERRQKILEYIKQNGTAKIFDLSNIFQVSEMTIHRDLSFLEEDGQVEKQYGGVILRLSKVEMAFNTRKTKNAEAKRKIGAAAANLVNDGDTIFIDASTTSLAIVPFLENNRNLTIFTSGIATASALVSLLDDNQIYCTGGKISQHTMSITGMAAIQFIRDIHVDKCFLGGAGVHLIHGVTDPGTEEVEIKRTAASISKELILLVDESKFGRLSRFTAFPLNEIDLIITDAVKCHPYVEEISKQGIEILHTEEP